MMPSYKHKFSLGILGTPRGKHQQGCDRRPEIVAQTKMFRQVRGGQGCSARRQVQPLFLRVYVLYKKCQLLNCMAVPDRGAYAAFEQGTHVLQPLVLQRLRSHYYCPQC